MWSGVKVVAGVAAVLVLAACSGGQAEDATPDGPTTGATEVPTSAAAPVPPGDADLVSLVYWESAFRWEYPPPLRQMGIMRGLSQARDDTYLAYLLDLAVFPNPYRADVVDVLWNWLGPYGDFDVFDWVEERGFRDPAEDTEEYIRFKRALFSTIQPEIGDFLTTEHERTISAQEVFWGGVTVDGIPPLEAPGFLTPEEASAWINPSDPVIGVEIEGDARAYPRRIIDWHEMVNDTVGGVPVSLAYCTLCGSAILYDGRVGDELYRFGTSGMLYRSNKLMYDRNTRTLWEQYTGVPVWGELVGSGIELETLPVVHTTYAEWLEEHPDTKVLDIETGFSRDYSPGAAYRDYFNSAQLIFPAPDRSGPLEAKDVLYAVRLDGETVGFPTSVLRERRFVVEEIAGQQVIVIATADGSGGRAYAAGEVTFTGIDGDLQVLEASDGRTFELTEGALVASDGTELARLPGHNTFWFSILNHTENGRLFEG